MDYWHMTRQEQRLLISSAKAEGDFIGHVIPDSEGGAEFYTYTYDNHEEAQDEFYLNREQIAAAIGRVAL